MSLNIIFIFRILGNGPKYGFSSHKGYGTKPHKDAILKYGLTPIHRVTFKGVVS